MPIKILLVEDDNDLRDSLDSYLTDVGFVLETRSDAEALDAALAAFGPDVVVLDINLPGMDGFAAGERVRRHDERIGLIMLTGRSMREDRLQGLSVGADHYLLKPADPAELEMAIRNLVRRLRGDTYAAAGDPDLWRLHRGRWTLTAPTGARMALTSAERFVMERLMQTPGQPVPRGELVAPRNRNDPDSDGRGLDVQVFRLRRKVERECGAPLPLLSARGVGYVFAGKVRFEED